MGIESNTREKIGSTARADETAVPCATEAVNAEKQRASFTPGPWSIFGEDEMAPGVPTLPIEAPHGKGARRVCEVSSTLDEDDDSFSLTEEDRANARLIAAAPTMLAALRDCAFVAEHGEPLEGGDPKAVLKWIEERAREAISKALAQSASTDGAIGEHGGNSP